MKEFISYSNRGLVSHKVILGLVVVGGLGYGAAHLGEGPETAAAAAFIGSFSFVVSAWLSYHGYILIMRAYRVWLREIGKQLELNRVRLGELAPKTITPDRENARRQPMMAHLVKVSFALTPTVLSTAATCSLMSILWAQIAHDSKGVILILLVICFVAVAITVAVQCFYLAYLHWRVVSLGHQLERMAALDQTPEQVIAPELRRISIFDDGIALATRVANFLKGGGLQARS